MARKHLIESALQDDACFVTIFNDYTNFEYVLKHQKYQKPFIHKLLANDSLLSAFATSKFYFKKLLEFYPQYRHRLIKRLLRNDILFSRAVTHVSDVINYADCKNHRRKLIEKLLTVPDAIKNILQCPSDLYLLAEKFPHYKKRLFTILKNEDHFVFFISSCANFACALERFSDPQQTTFIIEKIFSDNALFTKAFEFSCDVYKFIKKYPDLKHKIIRKIVYEHDILLYYFSTQSDLSDALKALPDDADAVLATVLNNQRLYLKIFYGLIQKDWTTREVLSFPQTVCLFLQQLPQYTAIVWEAEIKHRFALMLQVIMTQDPKKDGHRFSDLNSLIHLIEYIIENNQLTVDKVRFMIPYLNKAIAESNQRPILQEQLKNIKDRITQLCPATLTKLCLHRIAKSPLYHQEAIKKLPSELLEQLNKIAIPTIKI